APGERTQPAGEVDIGQHQRRRDGPGERVELGLPLEGQGAITAHRVETAELRGISDVAPFHPYRGKEPSTKRVTVVGRGCKGRARRRCVRADRWHREVKPKIAFAQLADRGDF